MEVRILWKKKFRNWMIIVRRNGTRRENNYSKNDGGGARLREPLVGPIPFCLGSMAERSVRKGRF